MTGFQGPGAVSAGELGEALVDQLSANPTVRDLEAPASIHLSGGPAARLHMTVDDPYRPHLSGLTTLYLILDGEGRRMVWMTCSAVAERPGGDWLSIAETIEFLAVED
jgi:hypothetical protein